ncbi:uncharacterized protein LOC127864667 [Dreissena polymorpha]|nr:uncharacterized protein LOC127864667 [Dreissena polymorpha]
MGIRPKDPLPNELEFEIDTENIKSIDFLVDDIRLDGARHILFATPVQLQLLQRAKRWFIDGTFKVVSRPFYQLMSIHAFIKKDDSVEQVPLLFVLMSRRQKRDYIAVFQSLIQHLAPEQVNVEWFMLDYEAAIYGSVTRCGLSATYSQGGDTYGFIRKVLALPFLPSEHIQGAYEELRMQAANGPEELHRLMAYVDRNVD